MKKIVFTLSSLLCLTLVLFYAINLVSCGFDFWSWVNTPFTFFIFALYVGAYLFSICYLAHLISQQFSTWKRRHKN